MIPIDKPAPPRLVASLAAALAGEDRNDILFALAALLVTCCLRWGVPVEDVIDLMRKVERANHEAGK